MKGDSWRVAGDLALLGIVVSLVSLPVFTLGAAFLVAGATIQHHIVYGRWLTFAESWALFRARFVHGLWAGPLLLAVGWLIAVDVAALSRGTVPGGRLAILAVLLVASGLVGFAALVAALGSLRQARAAVAARPAILAPLGGIVVIVAVLGMLVHPVLVPVLVGFALFAVQSFLSTKSRATAANRGESTTL
ncbi:hypothetical protein [Paractinoplanes atraurantiacus]|uniref:Membrane protein YesL n=1 Tax=Paractinoplanes atraurantiacus TaxID=1036182 RepID=A0A285J336_9ACTN|nr:hypothetical protein [Actinoplanes atraurantiacus]SNY54277.1 hypothetical protein SAMN05421748_11536 [Actinoplanes atraurantiacus]